MCAKVYSSYRVRIGPMGRVRDGPLFHCMSGDFIFRESGEGHVERASRQSFSLWQTNGHLINKLTGTRDGDGRVLVDVLIGGAQDERVRAGNAAADAVATKEDATLSGRHGKYRLEPTAASLTVHRERTDSAGSNVGEVIHRNGLASEGIRILVGVNLEIGHDAARSQQVEPDLRRVTALLNQVGEPVVADEGGAQVALSFVVPDPFAIANREVAYLKIGHELLADVAQTLIRLHG